MPASIVVSLSTIALIAALGWTILNGKFLATLVIVIFSTVLWAGIYVPYRKKHDHRGPGHQHMHGE